MSEAERFELQRNFEEISVSCHSLEDVNIAVKNGATQIILGTIFETDMQKRAERERDLALSKRSVKPVRFRSMQSEGSIWSACHRSERQVRRAGV